jgi:hypothetical protein
VPRSANCTTPLSCDRLDDIDKPRLAPPQMSSKNVRRSFGKVGFIFCALNSICLTCEAYSEVNNSRVNERWRFKLVVYDYYYFYYYQEMDVKDIITKLNGTIILKIIPALFVVPYSKLFCRLLELLKSGNRYTFKNSFRKIENEGYYCNTSIQLFVIYMPSQQPIRETAQCRYY